MIGWILMAREMAWQGLAGAPDNWEPSDPVRRHLSMFDGPSARYWRLFNEAERLGFGQTVSGESDGN